MCYPWARLMHAWAGHAVLEVDFDSCLFLGIFVTGCTVVTIDTERLDGKTPPRLAVNAHTDPDHGLALHGAPHAGHTVTGGECCVRGADGTWQELKPGHQSIANLTNRCARICINSICINSSTLVKKSF
jgi:hypothetical protein